MPKYGNRSEGAGRSNVVYTTAKLSNVLRNVAEINIEKDRKRAREIIQECRSGNYQNFLEIQQNWGKQECLQYFRVSEKEWLTWRSGYKKSELKNNPA